MFKKMFGPKKHDAQGTPVPMDELRSALMAFFPQDGEVNKYLTFDKNDKVHEGFAAVWEYFMRDRDNEGMKRDYLMTFTVNVDIRPDEKAVYFKSKRFARTKRLPIGTERFDPWFTGIGIGKLDVVKTEFNGNVKVFRPKKKLEQLVEQATSMGWDAYL